MTCVVASADSLGEGPFWDQATQSLWWLDIARPSRIHRFEPATGEHRIWYSNLLLTAMAKRSSGGFVLGGEDGVYFFDPATGAITNFVQLESDQLGNRSNDAACDPKGRLWIGSMQQNIGPFGEDLPVTRSSGTLYSVEPHGAVKTHQSDVGVSNGPCWSPDGRTFYFSDSSKQIIYAYDYDSDAGHISNCRIFNDSRDHGYPDGSTVDAEGFLWSARWDGSCILRIDPKGRIDRIVKVPATRPTCPCFGGANLDVIYVTSSRAHVSGVVLRQHPLQGGVFCFNPGVKGLLKFSFAG